MDDDGLPGHPPEPAAEPVGTGLLRSPRTSWLIAVAAAVLLGLGGGAWLLSEPARSCKGPPIRVTVAADPDIAPAVRQVAARFNVQTNQVRGRCVRADIIAPESVMLARTLAGQTFGARRGGAVDAWIPGSSIWLTLARAAGATDVPLAGAPVAASPVVLAVTRPVADELRAERVAAAWDLPARGGAEGPSPVRRMLEPSAGLSGVVPLLALEQLADEPARRVRDYVTAMRASAAPTSEALFAELTGPPRDDRALLVTTEQSVLGYNRAHRPNPAVPLIPTEGTLPVDFPFAILASERARRDAAEAFQYALSARQARRTLQRHGFRAPDGTLDEEHARSFDVPAAAPRPLRIPGQSEITAAVRAWNTERRDGRLVVLADLSRSMSRQAAEDVPQADRDLLGTRAGTRLGRMARALLDTVALLPGRTEAGLWVFGPGAGGTRPYQEVMAPSALDRPADGKAEGRPARDRLAELLVSMRARPRGDTGLYEALSAAVTRLRRQGEGERPGRGPSGGEQSSGGRSGGREDTLLVLTDGDDESALLPSLLERLRRDQGTGRQVRVDIVAFGPDADTVSLRRITELTGGELHATADPAALGAVFAEAISPHLCLLTC